MKTGDIVKIRDGSFLQEITKDGLESTDPQYHTPDMLWKVIETGLELPGEVFLGKKYINDTLIQGVSNPERIIFTQERFLNIQEPYPKQIKTECPHCKRIVHLSKGE
ncbi:MAG: hypothetical protein V3R78_10025 [Thermodesulfobacteriota bacterium]